MNKFLIAAGLTLSAALAHAGNHCAVSTTSGDNNFDQVISTLEISTETALVIAKDLKSARAIDLTHGTDWKAIDGQLVAYAYPSGGATNLFFGRVQAAKADDVMRPLAMTSGVQAPGQSLALVLFREKVSLVCFVQP